MKKRVLSLIMAGVMALGVVGCGSSTSAAKKAEEGNSKDLEEVTVVLDWYPNAVHGFIYDAIEKGYYEQEGLKVNVEFPSNTNDAMSLTAAGKADIGIYYLQDMARARGNEKVPIKAVGTIVQEPLNIILSLKDKNITKPEDLVGKKIGYAGGDLSEALVAAMLENQGKTADSTQLVDVGFDLMSSMTTGNVDATIGCMVNHEVPQLEKEGFDVNYFYPKDFGVPKSYELVFCTSEDAVSNNPEKLQKFLRASKKGFEDMKKNPEEALKILIKNQNAENFALNEDVERKSFERLIPVMEEDGAEFLSQDTKVWQDNIDWLYERGLLKEKFDASEIVTNLN